MATSAPWHVIIPQQAYWWQRAAERLTDAGFDVYTPQRRVSRRRWEALFPGYFFGHLSELDLRWHTTKQVARVRLLQLNGHAATLSDMAIDLVRQHEAELRNRPRFRPGDLVRVGDHAPCAWRGLSGTLARFAPADRVVIELLIGKVTVPLDWVEPA